MLSKGLKFVPVKRFTDDFQSKHDAETFFRRLRLKAHFHENNQQDSTIQIYEENGSPPEQESEKLDKLFPKKSSWTPNPGHYNALDLYIDKCRYEISRLNFKTSPARSNLSRQEWSTLTSLKKRNDIVIKPADKGGKVVVWRKDLYIQEGYSQLLTNSYQHLDKDRTKAFYKTIINAVKEEINNNNLPSNASHLYIQHPRTSVFYMLPKIHKPSNPGRPIVSAVSCPTSQIAMYLDSIFTPIVQSLPTFVKDSSDALRIFNEFSFTGPSKHLFSMDVKSLYTCIPHHDGLQALQFFLNRRPNQQYPPTTTLLRLAELILTMNVFTFNNDFFL